MPPSAERQGLTLDAGALIALDRERHSLAMLHRIARVRGLGGTICVPAPVVAQAWRSARQVRLAQLLRAPEVDVPSLDERTSRAIGRICAATGHSDVVDVHVALCAAERGHAVVTSDPDDLTRVDPSLVIIRI